MSSISWNQVLTHECWPNNDLLQDGKDDFLNGTPQKISAGVYGHKIEEGNYEPVLLLVIGGKSRSHEQLLKEAAKSHREGGFHLNDNFVWCGGAFIEYLNKVGELNIWGDSSTLEGGLTDEIEQVALREFSQLDWIDLG